MTDSVTPASESTESTKPDPDRLERRELRAAFWPLIGVLVGGVITAWIQFRLAGIQNAAASALADKQNVAAVALAERQYFAAVALAEKQNAATMTLAEIQNATALKQRRRDKAEEIITLVEEIAPQSIQLRREMESDPEHTPVPDNADHVLALVDLNFPKALGEARVFEGWNTCHMKELRIMANVKYAHRQIANDFDAASLMKTLYAGDALIAKVLKELGVKYTQRTVIPEPPAHCSPDEERRAVG